MRIGCIVMILLFSILSWGQVPRTVFPFPFSKMISAQTDPRRPQPLLDGSTGSGLMT